MLKICIKVFLLLLGIGISNSYNISIDTENSSCMSVLKNNVFHTIFFIADNDTDEKLTDCFLKKIHLSQSILLLRGFEEKPPNKQRTTNQPNFVMLTKGLNQDYLNDSSLKLFFRSHWNFVFIVVISNETSTTCVDGKLADDGLLRIQKFFNDLWHTYTMINVIMTFPVSCPNTYVIYDGKQKTNASLYDRTIKLVQPRSFNELFQYISDSGKELSEGYPLRAGMFNRFPTSITKCDKIHYYVPYDKDIADGFCGSDGLIMQDTLKYFKFNTIFSRDKNCDRYGYMNRVKGTVTGSLGCIINGEINISFNSRFMVPYTDDRFNYIYFISYDSLCAVLSIPEAHPLWYYPLNDLELKSWLLILAIIFTAAVVTKILQSSKKDLKEKNSFKILFYDYFACMLLGFSLSRKSNHCILRGGCLCASIVFLAIYQVSYTYLHLVLMYQDYF